MWRGVRMSSAPTLSLCGNLGCGTPAAIIVVLGLGDSGDQSPKQHVSGRHPCMYRATLEKLVRRGCYGVVPPLVV